MTSEIILEFSFIRERSLEPEVDVLIIEIGSLKFIGVLADRVNGTTKMLRPS